MKALRRRILKLAFFVPMLEIRNCNIPPPGGASFDPRGIICIKLVKVYKEMLHTKHQSSTPLCLREEEF